MAMTRAARPVFLHGALTVTTLVLLLPVFWMISTSLKKIGDVFSLPVQWIPSDPQFVNYLHAWSNPVTQGSFTQYTMNSVIVTASVTILNVALTSLAGYGLAKYRFAGRSVLFVLILITLMLPLEVIMVPLFLTAKDFGWLDTYQGLIFPVVADAFGVFLMRQWFRSLPDELLEAAKLDGAGHLRIFAQIALPLSLPAILTVAVFAFRETWDEFTWPYLIVSTEPLRTVPLGVRTFQQAELTNFPEIMAIATLASIPLAVLYFVFQKYFVRAIASAGVKG